MGRLRPDLPAVLLVRQVAFWGFRVSVSRAMLFLIIGNMAYADTLIDSLIERLVEQLPHGWRVELQPRQVVRPGSADATIELSAPSGESAALDVAVKRWTTAPTSAVAGVLAALQRTTDKPVLLATDYTNAPLRQVCEELGISYLDSTGWAYINVQKPAVFIRAEGEHRGPPPRETTNLTRLNGKAAGRLIRTLLAASPPIGVRELALAASTSPGSAAKLLPTLVMEGAVERDDAGRVTTIRRRALLNRWTADYSFLKSNGIVLDFVAPRGLQRILDQLARTKDVCATGSVAARTFLPHDVTPVVPVTMLTLYARNAGGLADRWGLVHTDRSTSNVLMTAPQDPQLTDKPERSADGLPRAPLGVVLADLLSLPGRAAQEAEQLMDVLAARDPSWS
jgi:hypothetical protein